MERLLTNPNGILVLPEQSARCAVLVLAGSSGRIETERTRYLARHGAVAASIRWFGDTNQPPGICEVPLETFGPVLDQLSELHEHLAIIGTSKGAEAALLLAARDPRIKTVAALSPTSVVWANVGAGSDGAITPPRSSWTAAGQPLPFVPHDPTWNMSHAGQPPAYRGLYEQSLTTYAERVETATIPVERISADVLLTAGGDDQVWPATEFADRIVTRRRRHDLPTRLLKNAGAGHRVLLPAEPRSASGEINLARGGTRQADDALGRQLWRELQHLLDLEPGE